MKQIETTHAVLIATLLPGAQPYRYVVSDSYDEDREPGVYEGVDVPDDVGEKWDRGILACRAAGIRERSREGLMIRCEIMHGTRELPPALAEWIDRVEATEHAKAMEAAATVTAEAEYHAHFVGYVDVGADEYASEYWTHGRREQLEEIARVTDSRGASRVARRLPNGDILETWQITGESYTRWTRDAALIAEHRSRSSILGYQYDAALASAMRALDKNLLTYDQHLAYPHWWGEPPDRSGLEIAFGLGGRAPTGPERAVRLRAHLERCIAEHETRTPESVDRLRLALSLVTDGSIAEVTVGTGTTDHRALLRIAIAASGTSARGFLRRYLMQRCEHCGHTPIKSARTFWRWLASEKPITLPDDVVLICQRVVGPAPPRRLTVEEARSQLPGERL